MDFAPVYLLERFFYRFLDFFHHWYVDGSRYLGHKFLNLLLDMDKTLAIQITMRHFFEPLYRDYSVIGRILGVIFRTGRVIVGAVFYLFITILFFFVYIIWIAAPIVPILYAARYL
jgi:hypothetical protein